MKKIIINGNKLRTYRTFKKSLAFENCLDIVKNTEYRQSITRIRVSSHNLFIESKRRLKIPVNERLCPFCITNIEDEVHFITECKKYDKNL